MRCADLGQRMRICPQAHPCEPKGSASEIPAAAEEYFFVAKKFSMLVQRG
jgi:hypothetical protein